MEFMIFLYTIGCLVQVTHSAGTTTALPEIVDVFECYSFVCDASSLDCILPTLEQTAELEVQTCTPTNGDYCYITSTAVIFVHKDNQIPPAIASPSSESQGRFRSFENRGAKPSMGFPTMQLAIRLSVTIIDGQEVYTASCHENCSTGVADPVNYDTFGYICCDAERCNNDAGMLQLADSAAETLSEYVALNPGEVTVITVGFTVVSVCAAAITITVILKKKLVASVIPAL